MKYTRGCAIPKTLKPGTRLVHNQVYPDGKNATGYGYNGSRVWTEDDPSKFRELERCYCKFAPEFKHYRVRANNMIDDRWHKRKRQGG